MADCWRLGTPVCLYNNSSYEIHEYVLKSEQKTKFLVLLNTNANKITQKMYHLAIGCQSIIVINISKNT